MWKALQGGLSAIAGTAEPEYGSEAIHPVGSEISAVSTDDLCLKSPSSTNVETMTFYFTDVENDKGGFIQIIHSNVMGLQITAQVNFKLFNRLNFKEEEMIWKSVKLENFEIVNGHDFKADGLLIELIGDSQYKISAKVDDECQVDFTFDKVGDGVKFGNDGTTLYGLDINEPWGSMRHIFWPRSEINGSVLFKGDKIQINNAIGMYVLALQGMKPHHAAAAWDFLNYQSLNYSVVIMEFTTPPSYGKTKVSLGIVVDSKGQLIAASSKNVKVEHFETEKDESSGWQVPTKISYSIDDKVKVNGNLERLIERVDVMAEIPTFVKNIASAASGTKPFIYQFGNMVSLEFGDVKDEGWGYSETTFISSLDS